MSEMPGQKIPFEELMALADGELAGETKRELEEKLSASPDEQALFEALRDDRARLAAHYAPVLEEPLPPGLEARILGRGPVTFFGLSRALAAGLAAAVVASLLAGGLLGFQIAERRGEAVIAAYEAQREQDRAALEQAVQKALETQVSGQAVSWERSDGANGAVTPLRTFRDKDGMWCREYRAEAVIGLSAFSQRAIACRGADGEWRTRMELLNEKPLAKGRSL
jgi:surface antigen